VPAKNAKKREPGKRQELEDGIPVTVIGALNPNSEVWESCSSSVHWRSVPAKTSICPANFFVPLARF
jgi:hypothetical protein